MARHVTTHVVTEVLETEGGFWCRACALPSGWVQQVVVRLAGQMHFQSRPWCDECGGRSCVEMTKS